MWPMVPTCSRVSPLPSNSASKLASIRLDQPCPWEPACRKRNALLAEFARFGVVEPRRYADLSDFDMLITGEGRSEATAEIRSAGVDIVTA